jgi:hypothetical protein
LCGDFRGLNKKLLIERFGIPLIKDILTALSGKVVFSELDLRQAYLQFDVAEEDRIKLTFRFDGKCYRWVRGIFGLANLSDHCQRIISSLFTDLADVEVYLDNIITATGLGVLKDGDLMAHALLLVVVIDRMTSSNLWLRSEKCFVLCDTLTTLGHQVSATGIRL